MLLVSGEPHPGERMWRNLLKSDANVELVHFTILRPPEKQDGTPINELSLIAFPTAELFGKKIVDFDLIMFDRYSNRACCRRPISTISSNMCATAARMAIVAGPDFAEPDGLYYTPIGKVIAGAARPARWRRNAFRAALSDTGARHPVTRGLPGERPASRPAGANGSGRNRRFPRGAPRSSLALMARRCWCCRARARGGWRLLLTDQSWLWARGYQGGGPYDDLMRRTAHWLMKEPELEEEALRATAKGREVTVERQSLTDQVGPAHIVSPSGNAQDLALASAEPGLFRSKFTAAELGLYRLSQVDLTALVLVGPENPLEYREVVSTTEKLRDLAEASGGSVRRIGGEGAAIQMPRLVAMRDSPVYAGSDYIGIRRTGASVARGLKLTPLAVGFFGLLAVLGALIAAWAWEGWRKRG